jgi:hypothetical protein
VPVALAPRVPARARQHGDGEQQGRGAGDDVHGQDRWERVRHATGLTTVVRGSVSMARSRLDNVDTVNMHLLVHAVNMER